MEKACVRSVLLFGSQTWSISTGDLSHIKTSKPCNDSMDIWFEDKTY